MSLQDGGVPRQMSISAACGSARSPTAVTSIINPAKGDRKGEIPQGTRFEDLPDDWKCPSFGAGKKMFKEIE